MRKKLFVSLAITIVVVVAPLFYIYFKNSILAEELNKKYLKSSNDFNYHFTKEYKDKMSSLKKDGEITLASARFSKSVSDAHDRALSQDLSKPQKYLEEFDLVYKGYPPFLIPAKAWQDKIRVYCYLGAAYSITHHDYRKVVEIYNLAYPLNKKYGNSETKNIFKIVFQNYLPRFLSDKVSKDAEKLVFDEQEVKEYYQSNDYWYLEEPAKAMNEALDNSVELSRGEKIGFFKEYNAGDLSAIWTFIDEDGKEFSLWQPFSISLQPDEFGNPYNVPKDIKLKVFWKKIKDDNNAEEDIITGYQVL